MNWIDKAGNALGDFLSDSGLDEKVFAFFDRVDEGIAAAERLCAGNGSQTISAPPPDTSHITEAELRPVMEALESMAIAQGITDFYSCIDEEMVRRFMVQGLSDRDIFHQFWPQSEPQPISSSTLRIYAVYTAPGDDFGVKLEILESLETLLSTNVDDEVKVCRTGGEAFGAGLVPKRRLIAFEFYPGHGGCGTEQ